MLKRLALLVLLFPAAALADDVEVDVGETKKIDVGQLRGLLCDDLSIASVDITTDTTTNSNRVTVTGQKVGRTACRVGEVGKGVTVPPRLIQITVRKPKPK